MTQIKELIGKCLFVIGAGFSKKAGCKMSSEMLGDLRIRIQNEDEGVFNKIEKETLNFLLSCLSYHCEWRSIRSAGKFKFLPNIEELILLMRRIRDRESYLPYPVTGSWADKLIQLETDFNAWAIQKGYEINDLFSSIELTIKKRLLKEWLRFDESNLSYLDPLKQFFQAYPNEEFCMDICSLNYDQVLESYFNESGIWKGFSNGEWVGLESEPMIEEEKRRINLYKLHGSLNWIRDIAGDIFESDKRSEQNIDEDEEQTIDQDPFIIFGQGIKTFSVEPFFSLTYHFKKLLKEKEYFFVLGYSFFDPYINNFLISATLGTNKKLIIVNPQFGPDIVREETNEGDYVKSQTGEGQFGECQCAYYQQMLAEYIQEIQNNSFYSELPEFNLSYVKHDSLFYIPWSTELFISNYLSNEGTLLINLIEQFEEDKKNIERPFE